MAAARVTARRTAVCSFPASFHSSLPTITSTVSAGRAARERVGRLSGTRKGRSFPLADSEFTTRDESEPVFDTTVRYRTVGDMSCTGAVESTATTVPDVIAEIAATRITERGQTRADDRTSEAAMEDRKREGYF